MLVDAGPDAQTASAVIAPHLRRLGVNRIDYLVLTHSDADHIGGAPTIMSEFVVGTIVHADDDLSHPVMREVMDLAGKAGIPDPASRTSGCVALAPAGGAQCAQPA